MTGLTRRSNWIHTHACSVARGVRYVATTTCAPNERTDSSVKKRPSDVLIGRPCHRIHINRQLSTSAPVSSPVLTGSALRIAVLLERVVSGFIAIVSGPLPPPSCAAVRDRRSTPAFAHRVRMGVWRDVFISTSRSETKSESRLLV